MTTGNLGDLKTWVPSLTSPLACCVTFGKWIHLSETLVFSLANENMKSSDCKEFIRGIRQGAQHGLSTRGWTTEAT